ncbi:uncharacterized [Tachysurus ichikawai]
MQPDARCPCGLKEPSFPRTSLCDICSLLHLFFEPFTRLVNIHAQAVSGVILQKKTCSRSSTQSLHILFASPNRASLRGGFFKIAAIIQALEARLGPRTVPLTCGRKEKCRWLRCCSLSGCRCGFSTTASRDSSRAEQRRHTSLRDARGIQPGEKHARKHCYHCKHCSLLSVACNKWNFIEVYTIMYIQ